MGKLVVEQGKKHVMLEEFLQALPEKKECEKTKEVAALVDKLAMLNSKSPWAVNRAKAGEGEAAAQAEAAKDHIEPAQNAHPAGVREKADGGAAKKKEKEKEGKHLKRGAGKTEPDKAKNAAGDTRAIDAE